MSTNIIPFKEIDTTSEQYMYELAAAAYMKHKSWTPEDKEPEASVVRNDFPDLSYEEQQRWLAATVYLIDLTNKIHMVPVAEE